MTRNVSYLNEKASGSRKTQSPDLYRLPAFKHDLEEKRQEKKLKKLKIYVESFNDNNNNNL